MTFKNTRYEGGNPLEAQAMKELRRLKVCDVVSWDSWMETFDDIWYAVVHETDMYEEIALGVGGSQAEYDEWVGRFGTGLNRRTYASAIVWLDKWSHLVRNDR